MLKKVIEKNNIIISSQEMNELGKITEGYEFNNIDIQVQTLQIWQMML